MDLSSYYSYLVPISWWKTEFWGKLDEHRGPMLVVAATTVLVKVVWGKYMAVSFLGMAFFTYPLSYRQIKFFMNLDIYGTTLAVANTMVDFACSTLPFLFFASKPLQVAVSYAHFTREWVLANIIVKGEQENKKSNELAQNLTTQVNDLSTSVVNLNKALEELRATAQKKQDVEQEQTNIDQQQKKIATEAKSDHAAIKQTIQDTIQLCKTIKEDPELKKQVEEADQLRIEISQLNSQCKTRDEELKQLTQDLNEIKTKLTEVLEKTIRGEIKTQEDLRILNTYLIRLGAHQSSM